MRRARTIQARATERRINRRTRRVGKGTSARRTDTTQGTVASLTSGTDLARSCACEVRWIGVTLRAQSPSDAAIVLCHLDDLVLAERATVLVRREHSGARCLPGLLAALAVQESACAREEGRWRRVWERAMASGRARQLRRRRGPLISAFPGSLRDIKCMPPLHRPVVAAHNQSSMTGRRHRAGKTTHQTTRRLPLHSAPTFTPTNTHVAIT